LKLLASRHLGKSPIWIRSSVDCTTSRVRSCRSSSLRHSSTSSRRRLPPTERLLHREFEAERISQTDNAGGDPDGGVRAGRCRPQAQFGYRCEDLSELRRVAVNEDIQPPGVASRDTEPRFGRHRFPWATSKVVFGVPYRLHEALRWIDIGVHPAPQRIGSVA